jgi:hypothetical protein
MHYFTDGNQNDADEVRGLSPEQMLAFFRDEFYWSLDTPEDIARENASIEMMLYGGVAGPGGEPH